MSQWHPIHENHAIDVMAAIVNFSEPIPDLLFKRVLKALEEVAFASGLRSRHLLQQPVLSIMLSPGQPQVQSAEPMVHGRLYNSIAEDGGGGGRVAEQVQITQTFIAYRTWQYVSWNWQLERIRALLRPALSVVVGSVFANSLRLEYLDRFYFDGSGEDASPELLLVKGSPYIAGNVFSQNDLWHSHTGAFVRSERATKELEQVHIDMVEQAGPNSAIARWANVMTAREARFTDTELEQSADALFGLLSGMHDDLIKLLGFVVTKEIANRIYLTSGSQ